MKKDESYKPTTGKVWPEDLPTLICFAGAGGTGKTSIVNKLHSRLSSDADGVEPACVIHRSIVREFYASKGVPDEASFLAMSASDRAEFQLALYDYYINKLEECCLEEKNNKKIVLCERSIFDHFAYSVYGSRELLDAEGLKALEAGVRRFKALKPAVFYLPYPTPWDHLAADGFRSRELAKDTIVDALIYKQLSVNRSVWTHTLPPVDIEARVKGVFHILWGDNAPV